MATFIFILFVFSFVSYVVPAIAYTMFTWNLKIKGRNRHFLRIQYTRLLPYYLVVGTLFLLTAILILVLI